MPAGESLIEERYRLPFLWAFFGTLLIKLALAFVLPLTNDEAYFYQHAIHPAPGYRDHPPMVAWTLYPFLLLGKSEWIVRLPAVLFSSLAGVGICSLLKPFDAAKARMAAILYLLSPLNVLFVLYTTDTPLYLFSFLSAFFFFRAVRGNSLLPYVLSGAFLGLAFLSKYLSVLLAASYALYFLFARNDRGRPAGAVLLFLSAAPFVAQNLFWNYTHSWSNVLFNFVNRNAGERFAPTKVALHVLTQAYLLTPPVLYLLYRERTGLADRLPGSPLRVFAFLFLAPLAVLTALSTVKTIGLHWALSFYPFLFPALFAVSDTERIARAARGMAVFTLGHVAVAAVLLALPLSAFRHADFYGDLVFFLKGREVAAALRPFARDYAFASTGYTQASRLTYYTGEHVAVFGPGSVHGRADDLWTDFRLLDGKDVLVFSKRTLDARELSRYFDSIEPCALSAFGAEFHYLLGKGFRYETYRDVVLRTIRDRFYAIPASLPTGRDFFRERYFGGSLALAPARH